MATKLTLDKDKLVRQLAELTTIAKKSKWVFDYDNSIDHMIYGLKVMPDDSFMVSINNEINLFLDKHTNLNGIFIENFSNNYLEHNPEFKPMLEMFGQNPNSTVNNSQELLVEKAFEGEIVEDSLSVLLDKDDLVVAV